MGRVANYLCLALIASAHAFANENANQNVNRFECTGCHGGGLSPNLPAAQAVSLIDRDTLAAVTKYEAGKTYKIQIRFNNPNTGPWVNAYVLHIAETSSGSALRAGSIINSGDIGVVTDAGPTVPQSNARILASAVKNVVDNAELEWQAPNSGRVRFQVLRMETNNSNNTGGDRVSQTIETFTFGLLGDTTPPEGEEDPAPTQSSGGTSDESSGSGFSSDLQAGCGLLQTRNQTTHWMALAFSLLMMFFMHQLIRARHRRSS